ncbi:MAG: hypothetical protein V8R51_08455, partial [Clostridia bacterium]
MKNQILINFGREAKSDEISDMLDISLQKIQELEVLQKLMERESWEQIESDRKDIEKVFERLQMEIWEHNLIMNIYWTNYDNDH